MFIEILFKILLFKGGVLIYAEQCVYIYIYREREGVCSKPKQIYFTKIKLRLLSMTNTE